MEATPETPVDWRGTPITPGALVIYGAPAGRSIAMVEAIIADPMLTPSGRIWLNVQRRAYGSSPRQDEEIKRVHVGADRLTVVETLPPTLVLTEQEKADRHDEQRERRQAWERAFHTDDHDKSAHTGHCRDCWQEGRRFDEAWEAGRPLDG